MKSDDSFESLICLAFASSFLNTLDSSIYVACTTEGKICLALHTLSFTLVRSIHILYTNITIGFWYDNHICTPCSGCLSTLLMTPMSSILLSSAFTLDNNGRATLLGVHKAKGLAFCFSLIWYSTERLPKPLGTS